MSSSPLLWFVVFVGLFEALAQSSIQSAERFQNKSYIGLAVVSYAVVCILLYKSYQYKGVGIVNVLWSGVSIVLMISIGYFIFGERITFVEWIGVVCILIGMCIIHACYKHV